MPQRGNVGFLLANRPLMSCLGKTMLVVNIQDAFSKVTKWIREMTSVGLLDELLKLVIAVCEYVWFNFAKGTRVLKTLQTIKRRLCEPRRSLLHSTFTNIPSR